MQNSYYGAIRRILSQLKPTLLEPPSDFQDIDPGQAMPPLGGAVAQPNRPGSNPPNDFQ